MPPRLLRRKHARLQNVWSLNIAERPMPQKSTVKEGSPKGSKPTKAKGQSHKPAKHIEEIARLASSVEPKKDLGKVRKATE